jgi:hypothetical protein
MAHNAVIFNISHAEGYAPEEVQDRSITLEQLLHAVEEAVDKFGGEARVVLRDSGNQYGATNYGVISQWVETFEPVILEDEDDDALGYGD